MFAETFGDLDPRRLAEHLAWAEPQVALGRLVVGDPLKLAPRAWTLCRRAALAACSARLAEATAVELVLGWRLEQGQGDPARFAAAAARRALRCLLPELRATLGPLASGPRSVRALRLAALVQGVPLDPLSRRARQPLVRLVADLRSALSSWDPPAGFERATDRPTLSRVAGLMPEARWSARRERVAGALCEARRRLAKPSPLDAGAARAQLIERRRQLALAQIDGLLAETLARVGGEESFASWRRRRCRGSWRKLALALDDGPNPPGTREPALAVAQRLIAARAALAPRSLANDLWRSRVLAAQHGPRRALEALGAPARTATALERRSLLCERVELLLEVGDVRGALAALGAQPAAVAGSRRLSRLDAWARWARGEPGVTLIDVPCLPPPLRRALEPVDNAAVSQRDSAAVPSHAPVDAAGLGAALLACVGTDGALVELDCPRDRPRHPRGGWSPLPAGSPWLSRRDGVDGGAPQGALSPEARTLLLLPLHGIHGAALGHLHLEFEHRVVPEPAVLRQAADDWAGVLARRTGFFSTTVGEAPEPVAGAGFDPRGMPERVADRLIHSLAGPARQWILVRSGRGTIVVAAATHRAPPLRISASLDRALESALDARAPGVTRVGPAAVASLARDGCSRGAWLVEARSVAAAKRLAGELCQRLARASAALAAAELAELGRCEAGATPLIGTAMGGVPLAELERGADDRAPDRSPPPASLRPERFQRRLAGTLLAVCRDRGRSEPRIAAPLLAALWRVAAKSPPPELRRLVEALLDECETSAPGRDDARRAAERVGLVWSDRVASLAPDPTMVRAALCATRTAGGRINKRAAARLLGWDVGTLARRLAEFAAGKDDDSHVVRSSVRRRPSERTLRS
ncbi:hypothetical protein [Engelhardtia mirabilis]|uniref:Uncharacterized protein n=1 Tax=Engelhardtia mirabilis TaxID=2528011 RepID=A0A518BQH4_9BACT|nr:hypothetical protein Pla133_43440 [Planctomycetes bacterium Pla133]QDV03554.1 hypothetical protein Pla86_43430 [Planctomycetes bacterium Pla86]